MNNIILAGFMGCGKTTIAKALARKLKFSYMDTDEEIVRIFSKPISRIFSEAGEEAFRDLEHEVVKSLKERQIMSTVVATGGGVLTFARNASILKQIGTIVIIDRDLDSYIEYLSKDSTRPLVFEKSMSEITKLYNARLDKYRECADIIVQNNASIDACVNEIIKRIA